MDKSKGLCTLLKTKQLSDFTYQNINETDIEKKELVILMMRDIIVSETGLQEAIVATLKN